MPLKQETQNELKKSINQCDDFEGRYYLLHIYEYLLKSQRSDEEVEAIAQHLIHLIQNINDIKNPENSLDKQFKAATLISENYEALAKEVGTNGILYKAKQAILGLGGFVLGLVLGTFSAVIGAVSLGISDIKNFRLPSGFFIGGFTGFLVGLVIGMRTPHGLLKEKEKRLLQHTVHKLGSTFESLYNSVENDYVTDIKQELLTDYFAGDTEQFNKFLKEKQQYEILGVEAVFISPTLKGSAGHHSLIKFSINGNEEKPKLIELGLPSDKETEFSQRETRETTGEQLVRMLALDRSLQSQYEIRFDNLIGLLSRYDVGVNDCHTYVDKILISVGEPESLGTRFTPEDTFIGRLIGNAINFFRAAPEKLNNSNLTDNDYENGDSPSKKL